MDHAIAASKGFIPPEPEVRKGDAPATVRCKAMRPRFASSQEGKARRFAYAALLAVHFVSAVATPLRRARSSEPGA